MSIRILHVDLDAFFVEVCRRHDPALRDVDLLVVGGKRESRGVVQSASYGARAFGVKSGMPIAEAVRRCPKATFVQGPFSHYRDASHEVREVLESHAPMVAMTGLDEGYLDFSGTDLIHPVSLLNVATAIRNDVHATTGLDCSIGIGPNRMIAKIASDYAKPRGACEVREGWEKGFMAGLPLRALPGIGPKTAAHLAECGLVDVAQVQAMSIEDLTALVGREDAMSLARRASGRGGSIVRTRERVKSVSRETTFNRDISDLTRLDRVLLLLVARVAAQLRDEELEAGALVLKLRHGDFLTVTRRMTLKPATSLDTPLRDAARKLLAPAFAAARQRGQAIRLLGVAATSLEPIALADLFTPPTQVHQEDVARAVDKVRARYGFDAVRPGRLVEKKKKDG